MSEFEFDASLGWIDDEARPVDHREEDEQGDHDDDQPDDVSLDALPRDREFEQRVREEDEREREFRAMSGRVRTHGRERRPVGTGRFGSGIRGLRYVEDAAPPRIRPNGRSLGGRTGRVRAAGTDDWALTVGRAIGPERMERLRASFTRGGRPSPDDARDRDYLAVVLELLYDTRAQRAAAAILGTDMRKMAKTRRRSVSMARDAEARREIRQRMSPSS